MSKKASAFTIVELLIVIVVIAILAAISIVAYTGIQDRAKYSSALSSLQQIKKAVDVYYAENGTYPHAGTVGTFQWRYYCDYKANPTNFIPAIASTTPTIPAAPCNGATNSDDTWLYGTDGNRYKLVYARGNVSGAFRDMVPSGLRDPVRWSVGTTWGYWTDTAQSQ